MKSSMVTLSGASCAGESGPARNPPTASAPRSPPPQPAPPLLPSPERGRGRCSHGWRRVRRYPSGRHEQCRRRRREQQQQQQRLSKLRPRFPASPWSDLLVRRVANGVTSTARHVLYMWKCGEAIKLLHLTISPEGMKEKKRATGE